MPLVPSAGSPTVTRKVAFELLGMRPSISMGSVESRCKSPRSAGMSVESGTGVAERILGRAAPFAFFATSSNEQVGCIAECACLCRREQNSNHGARIVVFVVIRDEIENVVVFFFDN